MIPLLLMLLVSSAQALEVRELSLNYRYFHPSARDPFMITPLKEGVSLRMNLGLAGPCFWDNDIVAITDPGQYKTVAWNFHLGCTIMPGFDVEYEHMSRHLLDDKHPWARWPVQDSVGFRWYLIGPARQKPLISW